MTEEIKKKLSTVIRDAEYSIEDAGHYISDLKHLLNEKHPITEDRNAKMCAFIIESVFNPVSDSITAQEIRSRFLTLYGYEGERDIKNLTQPE